MTRVDFVVGAPDKLHMACKVTRKQYLARQRLLVYCADPVRLNAFDRLLWSFEDVSFIPHVLASDTLAGDTPVLLTTAHPTATLDTSASFPWLLNLDDQCPPNYQVFPRLLEIVSSDDADRQFARQRWRTYHAQGDTLHSHTVGRG